MLLSVGGNGKQARQEAPEGALSASQEETRSTSRETQNVKLTPPKQEAKLFSMFAQLTSYVGEKEFSEAVNDK